MPRIVYAALCALIMLFALPVIGQTPVSPLRGGTDETSSSSSEELDFYKQKSYALLIVNSDYEYYSILGGVKKDVTEVEKVLKEHDFEVIIRKNLKKEDLVMTLLNFLSDYGQISQDNRLLIYYMGHGESGKFGYFVPVDAPQKSKNESEFLSRAVQMSLVANIEVKSKHVFFVFDSCFSGAITRAVEKSGSSVPGSIKTNLEKSVTIFLPPVPKPSACRTTATSASSLSKL